MKIIYDSTKLRLIIEIILLWRLQITTSKRHPSDGFIQGTYFCIYRWWMHETTVVRNHEAT
jgi:hypothetical protein